MELSVDNILALFSVVVLALALVLVLVRLPQLRAAWPEFMQYRHLLGELVKRDVTVKYRRSVLGVLWSVLQPLFIMLIVTFVFSYVFRIDVVDYPVFYITGNFVFGYVSEATNLSLGAILGSGNLIRKVFIPKYLFVLEKCLFALVNTLFSLIAVAIVLVVQQAALYPTFPLLVVPLLYAAVFALGLGLLLSALVVFFRDVAHIYGIWLTAWFYLTPVLYPLSILPPLAQSLIRLNPLVHYVEYARDVMMYGLVPGWQANLICLGMAVAMLLLGILVFCKTQDKFVLYL
ncbi:MAG: ABC transporter permease [Coriobacteriales bacterium]|jgi:ABC-2 type transport system permease protein|nr:ABC transporter permease [Coriobacteriales bacterium]